MQRIALLLAVLACTSQSRRAPIQNEVNDLAKLLLASVPSAATKPRARTSRLSASQPLVKQTSVAPVAASLATALTLMPEMALADGLDPRILVTFSPFLAAISWVLFVQGRNALAQAGKMVSDYDAKNAAAGEEFADDITSRFFKGNVVEKPPRAARTARKAAPKAGRFAAKKAAPKAGRFGAKKAAPKKAAPKAKRLFQPRR